MIARDHLRTNRVTLRPGESGQSTVHYEKLGTGIGEIHVRP
ncbi:MULTISPECIES: hypothetical protein [unclassified Streptomyces]